VNDVITSVSSTKMRKPPKIYQPIVFYIFFGKYLKFKHFLAMKLLKNHLFDVVREFLPQNLFFNI